MMKFDSLPFFIGFRSASFSGTGTHNGNSGRYNYTYVGPMIAFKSTTRTHSQPVIGIGEKIDPLWYYQKGTILRMGFSVNAKLSSTDSSMPLAEDFRSPRGPIIPASGGFWIELALTRYYFDAIGYSYVGGFQKGSGKSFVWLGIEASTWY